MSVNNSADSKKPNTEKDSVSLNANEAENAAPAVTTANAYMPLCDCPDCDDCADTIPVNSISLHCTTSTIICTGTTGRMTATVKPSNATNKTVTFSSNSSVLSCTSAGVYTAKSVGTAKITATASNGVTASKTFTVQAAPARINVNKSYICLKPGCNYYIHASVTPSNASQSVNYTSGNTYVAEVGDNGRVCAHNCGQTYIKVTSSMKSSVYTYVTICVKDTGCNCDDCADTVITANEPLTEAYSVYDDEITSSHSIGPNAVSMVDLRSGRLQFDVTDFAWEGLLSPVTIRHLYTAALKDKFFSAGNVNGLTLKDYSKMKIGYGWRLNYMVSLNAGKETLNGKMVTVYTFVDRNGYVYKLYPTDKANIYADLVNAGVTLDASDPNNLYATVGTDEYNQTDGHIFRIYDTSTGDTHSDQTSAKLTYTISKGNRVSKVKDGNNREFLLNYTGDFLTSITAPDGSKVNYIYSGNLLTKITYPRGESLLFAYDTLNRVIRTSLYNKNGVCEYTLQYCYSGAAVTCIQEYGANNTIGRVIQYIYGGDYTRVKTNEYTDSGSVERTTTTYLFDKAGELLDSYTEHGGYMQSAGMEDNFGSVGSSEVHSYERSAQNLLFGHGFEKEDDLAAWETSPGSAESTTQIVRNQNYAHDGKGCLCVTATGNEVGHTLYQTQKLPAGEYTFSAYVKVLSSQATGSGSKPGIYITINGADGTGASSVKVSDTGKNYLRLFAAFTSSKTQNVTTAILIDGDGKYYIDSAQMEQGGAPGAYSVVENGSFRKNGSGWLRLGNGTGTVTATENLDALTGTLRVKMDDTYTTMPCQYLPIKSYKNAKTSFTLSGFARLSSAYASDDPDVKFRLRACITYVGDESAEWQFEDHCANFSQKTDEWQYVSLTFTKEQYRTIDNIAVLCEYFTHDSQKLTNTYARFDSVALTVGETEYNLTESDFGQYNAHEDDENMCDIEADQAGFEEVVGRYNMTLSTTTYSEDALGTIYRAKMPNTGWTGYKKSIDSRGNETLYTTDPDTSRVTQVTDRTGNITTYRYDAAGNVTQICECDENADNAAGVNFTYGAFNELQTAQRSDGMTYRYGYNAFHRPETISISGRSTPLVRYGYKNRNGSLKTITYANGHTANLTYNRFGRLVRAVWKDAYGSETQDTKYSYDGNGNPISVLDITNKREYTYVYEHGRLVCEMESEGAFLTNKGYKGAGTLVRRTAYRYNSDGRIAERTIWDAIGNLTEKYTYTEKGEATVTLPNGAKTRSRTDALGRRSFDEIQTGSKAITRKFTYLSGAVTEMHEATGKIYSEPTTELVGKITYSDGSEQQYAYDNEERITSFTATSTLNDFLNGVGNGSHGAFYEYDCHGQLTKETYTDYNGKKTVTEVTYDAAGNILTKSGNRYQYGDGAWSDLLTSYNGQTITYDALGNPTTYLGSTMTWTTGRRLRSYCSDNSGEDVVTEYTYNSLGQRIGKTVGSVKHTYIYDGARLVQETQTESNGTKHTLVFFYDASESPIGMKYDDTVFYYKKNLQGDIIELLDENGGIIAEYIYNAWGELRNIRVENLTNLLHAKHNPFRYRGYYFDDETGFYYVFSRYYDPEVGRFLSSDDVLMLLLAQDEILYNNLYSYCGNSPVTNVDSGGYIKLNIKWLGSAIDLIIWLIPALFAIAKIWKTVSKSANKLVSFGNKLISVGKQLFKRFDNRLYCAFARDSTYRIVRTIGVLAGIITIISSIGNIVQYIIDILDGRWDGYLDTSRFGPKLDLTRDY